MFLLVITVLIPISLNGQDYDISSVQIKVDFRLRDSVDNIGNQYIRYAAPLPSVLTFVNADGSITVCTSDENEKTTYIFELSIDLKEQKRITIKNELDMLGAFTKDIDGNYYFFYGARAANQAHENMAVVKYNKKCEKILEYKLRALAPDSFGGIRIPFDAGTCRIELSGQMLAIYFAREMFNGHQASYGFILDKDSFKKTDRGQVTNNSRVISGNNVMPYTSHSFNQFILPIKHGFIFADHGDAYPRAFTFAKWIDGAARKDLKAFTFRGSTGQNATWAEMGGVAKTAAGYIFLGTYGPDINTPRNPFILTFDEELKTISAPFNLTKHTKEDGHAGHSKIAQIGENQYIILWEMFRFSTQSANVITRNRTEYISTQGAVINEKGEFLSGIFKLESNEEEEDAYSTFTYDSMIMMHSGPPIVRLNMNDVLRHNPANGKVYWAVNDSSESIRVFSLAVNSEQ